MSAFDLAWIERLRDHYAERSGPDAVPVTVGHDYFVEILDELLRARRAESALGSKLGLAWVQAMQVDLDRRLAEVDVVLRCRVRDALTRWEALMSQRISRALPVHVARAEVDEAALSNVALNREERSHLEATRALLAEVPRKLPQDPTLPEEVARLRACTSPLRVAVDQRAALAHCGDVFFTSRAIAKILQWLRTATITGADPGAIELLRSVVALAREGRFGTTYQRGEDLPNTAMHPEDSCDARCDCIICEAERYLARFEAPRG